MMGIELDGELGGLRDFEGWDKTSIEQEATRTSVSRLHPDLKVTENFVLLVKKLDARADEEQFYPINLNKYWLAPNAVYPNGLPLASRADLTTAIIEVINAFLYRVDPSKSRHTRVAFIVGSVAKFFEYMWLNDIYKLSQLTGDLFDRLFDSLVEGGWHSALSIKVRLDQALSDFSEEDIGHPIFIGDNQNKSVKSKELKKLLATNIETREVAVYFRVIKLFQLEKGWILKLPKAAEEDSEPPSGYGYSILRQTLEAINMLYGVTNGPQIFPYFEHVIRSKRATSPPGKTINMSPAIAGMLLSSAFAWVYDYSEHVLKILSELCDSAVMASREGKVVLGCYFEKALSNSSARRSIEELIGLDIKWVDCTGGRDGLSVRDLIQCLQTACFIVVAALNARRRDEIEHRKFGIHYGCCKEVEDSGGLYELTIYVEKSLKDYDVFYVGESTVKAVSVLEKMQDCYVSLDKLLGRDVWEATPPRERVLFSYRRMSRIAGVGEKKCWFHFEACSDGAAKKFLSLALNEDVDSFPIRPHMFRRMYCLIFMYRYEFSDIRYLSQHLRHGDLVQTQTYITDPENVSELESIDSYYGPKHASLSSKQQIIDIQLEMREVANEKLGDIVFSIIAGDSYAGGFSRFVRKIYKNFMKSVDFTELDIEARANKVASRLQGKGYLPEPFKHGNCMAGSARAQLTAACRSSDGTGPKKMRASPKLCSKCPLHCTNVKFLENLKADFIFMKKRAAEMEVGSLELRTLNEDADNLEELIQHYDVQFGS